MIMSLSKSIIKKQIDTSILFKTLDEQAREELSQIALSRPFKDLDILIAEGAINNELFLIVSGNVHVWTSAEDIFIDLKDLGPGDYFGEVGFA